MPPYCSSIQYFEFIAGAILSARAITLSYLKKTEQASSRKAKKLSAYRASSTFKRRLCHLSFCFFPAAAVRGNQLNIMLPQKVFVKRVAAIGFVNDKFIQHSADEEAVKGGFRQLRLMRRSTCKAYGDRKTGSVRNDQDSASFTVPLDLSGSYLKK